MVVAAVDVVVKRLAIVAVVAGSRYADHGRNEVAAAVVAVLHWRKWNLEQATHWIVLAGVLAVAVDGAAAFAFVFVVAAAVGADCYSRPKQPPLAPT